jgi:hypothetical protein
MTVAPRCFCVCHCGGYADARVFRAEGRWARADALDASGDGEALRGVGVDDPIAAATACAACARFHVSSLSGRPPELEPPPRRAPRAREPWVDESGG